VNGTKQLRFTVNFSHHNDKLKHVEHLLELLPLELDLRNLHDVNGVLQSFSSVSNTN
jgi:hypothetical protein